MKFYKLLFKPFVPMQYAVQGAIQEDRSCLILRQAFGLLHSVLFSTLTDSGSWMETFHIIYSPNLTTCRQSSYCTVELQFSIEMQVQCSFRHVESV